MYINKHKRNLIRCWPSIKVHYINCVLLQYREFQVNILSKLASLLTSIPKIAYWPKIGAKLEDPRHKSVAEEISKWAFSRSKLSRLAQDVHLFLCARLHYLVGHRFATLAFLRLHMSLLISCALNYGIDHIFLFTLYIY